MSAERRRAENRLNYCYDAGLSLAEIEAALLALSLVCEREAAS